MDCPLCSSSIKLRTARRGRNTGSQFWGCSRYPACGGTRQANDEAARRPSRYFVSPFRHLTRRIVSRYEVRKIGGLCWSTSRRRQFGVRHLVFLPMTPCMAVWMVGTRHRAFLILCLSILSTATPSAVEEWFIDLSVSTHPKAALMQVVKRKGC
jgi:hypothetical protein